MAKEVEELELRFQDLDVTLEAQGDACAEICPYEPPCSTEVLAAEGETWSSGWVIRGSTKELSQEMLLTCFG